jgi:hypothetical protein
MKLIKNYIDDDFKLQCINWLKGGPQPRHTKTINEIFYFGKVMLIKRNPQFFDLDQQLSKLQNDEVLTPPEHLKWCDLR